MPRSALLIALAVGSVVPSTLAQLPPERFLPISAINRFKPEKLPALESPAYYGDFEKARSMLHFGRYRQALYASFALKDVDPIDLALLRGEVYWHLGSLDVAKATLLPHVADGRTSLLLARIELAGGDSTAAIARLKPLVDADPNAVAPRHWLAMAYEAAGNLDAAVEQHRHFAEGDDSVLARFEKDGALAFEVAEDLTLAATSIDRWAAISMQYQNRQQLHDTILAMFVAAYDTVDRDYWPAHVAAAKYSLAYGNKAGATEELEAANAANPNAESVNALMGEMALDARNEAGVEEAVRSLRSVDPDSFTATLLDVRLKLFRRDFANAHAQIKAAIAKRPTDLDGLATLAAAQSAVGDDAGLAATYAKIDAIDPKNAKSRMLVADTLSTVYYDATGAVKELQTAVERAPWWTEPQHALGVALIQDGEEDKARLVLDAAYQVDPYNLITVNYLRVLDKMQKFKEFESARFIFKYAEEDDPIIPLYVAPQMDAMYDDLAKAFKFEPPKKPIIEVFPDAQSFSVRTAGTPGLETYGASLGRVMTTVAPRAGQTLGPFNWNRVLRHEFTHTMNLMYTRGRVPRWLTEGLAVWQEHVPYRFANVPEALYDLAANDNMPTPADMRQVRSEMHYMTAFWIVRYIDETQGWDHILKLLDGYRAGKEENDVFKDATGMDVKTFHEKFSAWAKDQVKDWGYDAKTKKDAEIVEKEAERLTQDGLYDPAIEKWNALQKLQPLNPLPPRRLAGIYLRQEKPAEALPELIKTLPLELQDNRFAKRVSRLYDEAGDPSNAMKYANFAIGIDPYDPDAHDLLAGLHTKAGDTAKAKQEEEVAKLLRQRGASVVPSPP